MFVPTQPGFVTSQPSLVPACAPHILRVVQHTCANYTNICKEPSLKTMRSGFGCEKSLDTPCPSIQAVLSSVIAFRVPAALYTSSMGHCVPGLP